MGRKINMLGGWVPVHIRPTHWFLVFRRRSPLWWVNLVPGKHKHVCAFGPIPGQDIWLFLDYSLHRLDIVVVPDAQADDAMAAVMSGATVVRFTPPEIAPARWWRPLALCTGLVALACGIRSGALRPDRLLRDVLAEGGTIIQEPRRERAASAATGIEPVSRETA
jgi:hypothetical protein